MIKISKSKESDILSLLKNKKFKKLKKIIDSLSDDEKETPFILNVIGILKVSKEVFFTNDAREALMLFEKAYKKDKSFHDSLYNYASISLKTHIIANVLHYLKDHLKREKNDLSALTLLGSVYYQLGKIEDSINCFKKTVDKKETRKFQWQNLLGISNYSMSLTHKSYMELGNKYSNSIKKFDEKELESFKYSENKEKIRIGFFSTNLKKHSVANFLIETIKTLNLNSFETIAFNQTLETDEITKEFKSIFSEWYDVHSLTDLDTVNLIRNKKINILFDLVGYTEGSRMEIFKNRSAPIQISWIGYTNSTCINEMDYIIVDPYVIEKKQSFTEKFIKLPNIWSCHTPIKENIKVEKLPALKNKYITFGSFNSFSKISDETIDIWSELLIKTNSKLILKSSTKRYAEAKIILLSKFKKHGVNLENIKILERTANLVDHLKCYNNIDIALDTFPYNGATTSFEAIWMGVPVLTIYGSKFNSRYGYSINKNLDLRKFIASNKNDFVNKGISTSSNLEELSELRKNIRHKALNSALFDTKRFNENFIKEINRLF